MQETWVRSLGREDPLDKGMATHSSIPAWRIPWREEPGRLQSMGLWRVRHGWATITFFSDYIWSNSWVEMEEKIVFLLSSFPFLLSSPSTKYVCFTVFIWFNCLPYEPALQYWRLGLPVYFLTTNCTDNFTRIWKRSVRW